MVHREEIRKIREDILLTRKEYGGHVNVQIDDRPSLSKNEENMDAQLVQKINAELRQQATFNRYMDQKETYWKALADEGQLKMRSYDDKQSSSNKCCCF